MLKERFDSAPLVVDETNNKQDPKTMAKCSTNVALAANSYDFLRTGDPSPREKIRTGNPSQIEPRYLRTGKSIKKSLGL